MGFTFDDTDRNGVANPICLMQELLERAPSNAERIRLFIGGEEVNDSPIHRHHRYVIDFGQMSEEEARQWPDLLAIVEAKVKPDRLEQNREIRARYWWRFGEVAPTLYRAIRGFDLVLVIAQISSSFAFTRVEPAVFSHRLVVFAVDPRAGFPILQSRPHEVWARFYGATMKDDLTYTPSDCFETFPFPSAWDSNPALEQVGRKYYEFRAALMVRNNEGLTKTYNRFHDPDEHDPDIKKLRELHDAMDRAVLDAYGWTDIRPTCEFILDYEDEEEDTPGKVSKKKKPWRYRWPDDIRDEVLGRLLELNAQRAKEEALAGSAAVRPAAPKRKRTKSRGDTPLLDGQS